MDVGNGRAAWEGPWRYEGNWTWGPALFSCAFSALCSCVPADTSLAHLKVNQVTSLPCLKYFCSFPLHLEWNPHSVTSISTDFLTESQRLQPPPGHLSVLRTGQVCYCSLCTSILSAWIFFPSLFAGLTISTQFLSEMLSFRISSQITNSKYPPNTHTHTFTILILTALCSLMNVIALRAVCGMEQMLGKYSENKWICVNEWRNGHIKLAAKSEK